VLAEFVAQARQRFGFRKMRFYTFFLADFGPGFNA
jgi:hypothetical protein